jgi:hypothetical protein
VCGTGNGNGNGYGNAASEWPGQGQVRPETFVGSGAFDSTRPEPDHRNERSVRGKLTPLVIVTSSLVTRCFPPYRLTMSSTTFVPTTRSRTLLFISYRDSSARAPPTSRSGRRQYQDAYHTNDDENEGLINHQGTPHISLDVELPPKWFVRSECHISRIFSHPMAQKKTGSTT